MHSRHETGQVERASDHWWRFGHCEFNELKRELRVAGSPVELEAKPLEVLHQLLLHAGEVVTKDELLDSVWPGLSVVDGSLATAVSKLRKVLGSDEDAIATVPRIGYRLAVPVHTKAVPPPEWSELHLAAGAMVPGRDQWRLTRRLDRSPSSEVWLAEHPKTREVRVFKFANDPVRLRSLKREVTLARLLRESLGERPDFVRLLEWNFDTQPYFIESEYAGPNLIEWAQARGGAKSIPLDQRLRLAGDVVDAVGMAHGLDVLHKDLKPTNILIAEDARGRPQIKVADFGIATLLSPARLSALGITSLGFTQTADGTSDALMGSVMYVAPEVLAGQSPTAASDVYALGVLLYQFVVGDFRKSPTPGWEADIDDPLLREDIADAACGDPARRLSTAAALAERLHNLDGRRDQRAKRAKAHEPTGGESRAKARRPSRLWTLTAAAAAVLALIVGLAWRARSTAATSPAESQITSLAVLPLLNMSGDPAEDYFADGMTEALIIDLSKIRALRVISRTSVMQYKGTKKPLPQIARELNVDGVVEGSVVRAGDRVRLSARLIHAATESAMWAENYDRDVRDILNLQRELARQVSREIRITVQPSENAQLATSARVDPKAHELYLRGRFFWNRRTRDDLLKAVEHFQRATEIDPADALSYAGLADAYVELVGFGNIPPTEGIPKARAAALKSSALDPSLAEPHAAMGYGAAADWQWTESESEFQRALELNPGYAVALYQYGFVLSMFGRQAEAVRMMERALAVDPLSPIVHYRAGRVYYQARQFDQAIEQFKAILELNPNEWLGLYGLGLVNWAQGNFDQAIS